MRAIHELPRLDIQIRQAEASRWRGSKLAVFGASAVALFGAHAMEAPAQATADTCVTTQTAEATTTTCGPDSSSPSPQATPAPAPAPKKPHHKTQSQTGGLSAYYSNPFRAEMKNHTLYARRIDQGVDYSGSGPVYALGNGRVTEVTESSSYWANEGGNAVVYRLSDGRAKDRSVFVAENCTPNGALYIGKKVFAGRTVICQMHDSFPYIETGWAQGGIRNDKPADYQFYSTLHDGSEMAYGLNMSHLLHDLGAPAGNTHPGHVSFNEGTIMGRLPADFPNWPVHVAG